MMGIKASGSSVIAVDLFYTVFAVMFILEATTKDTLPTQAAHYPTHLSLKAPAGTTAANVMSMCLAYFEVGPSPESTISNIADGGLPGVVFENDACVFNLTSEVALPSGNSQFYARTMLVRYPSDDADGELRIGKLTVPVKLTRKLKRHID